MTTPPELTDADAMVIDAVKGEFYSPKNEHGYATVGGGMTHSIENGWFDTAMPIPKWHEGPYYYDRDELVEWLTLWVTDRWEDDGPPLTAEEIADRMINYFSGTTVSSDLPSPPTPHQQP